MSVWILMYISAYNRLKCYKAQSKGTQVRNT